MSFGDVMCLSGKDYVRVVQCPIGMHFVVCNVVREYVTRNQGAIYVQALHNFRVCRRADLEPAPHIVLVPTPVAMPATKSQTALRVTDVDALETPDTLLTWAPHTVTENGVLVCGTDRQKWTPACNPG